MLTITFPALGWQGRDPKKNVPIPYMRTAKQSTWPACIHMRSLARAFAEVIYCKYSKRVRETVLSANSERSAMAAQMFGRI